MSENIYSKERKELQAQGLAPEWMTTGGWQMFKQKYLYKANNPREQYQRIASTLAKHISVYPDWWETEYGKEYTWEQAFFDILWNNHLSPSTPVLGNTGTDRGCTVSCSGTYIGDNVYSFYENLQENAVLTQEGFGTSSYLGDIRPRGTPISRGGKASGILPVFKAFVQMSSDISQGSNRRGAWAGSVPIDHPDWDEVCDFVNEYPDDVNAAWLINDAFRDKLLAKDKDALRRWGKALKVKMTTGKGYLTFIDKINRKRPEMYVDKGLTVKASQLCQEITLFSDEDHSFTCVLSSVNAYTFRKWPPKLVFIATVFLDCVCEEFLQRARNIPGLEKAVRFTEKSRALGLGVMGLSSLFQEERIVFGSLESMYLNTEIFKKLKDESEEASIWMAQVIGEPEWCKGYGVRNTHRCVSGDTKVLTKRGQVKISDLIEVETDVWNGKNWSKVVPFVTGHDSVYRVTFSNGLFLDCTKDHKFLVATPKRDTSAVGGLKTIEVETTDLRIGDCLPKFLVEATGTDTELSYAYTAGLFCGDGSINCSKEGKYPRNELRLYGDKMLLAEYVDWKSSNTWGGDSCVRGYLPDDLLPKYSVPHQYSIQSKQAWLAGLVDSDGSATSSGIAVSMKDYEFAKEVALLVQSLGGEPFVSKCTRVGGYKAETNEYFTVNITSHSLHTVFSQFKPKRVKINTPKAVTKIGKTRLVEVVSVEYIGETNTYCFTEKELGQGVFNGILTKQCAVAPTKSTALIMGGMSEGINIDPAMTFTQTTTAGEVDRMSPVLLKLMKEKGVYNKKVVQGIVENLGSVQHVDWLDSHEKAVFRTAFETDQFSILRLASQRQRYLSQMQSLNLFFSGDESEEKIGEVMLQALLDENILSVYYAYSKRGVLASTGECEACQ